MYLTIFIAAVLQLVTDAQAQDAPIIGGQLYNVSDVTGAGSIKVTATKVYNSWNQYGNKTKFDVELYSPLLYSNSQEIRVAIQWQWQDQLGTSSERVAFYAEVKQRRFDIFRIDTHLQTSGSYQFENYFFPIMPKNSLVLPPQDPDDEDRYVLVESEEPQISLDTQTAKFSFIVNRDEPLNIENQIWLNWGIFDNTTDTDFAKVQGQRKSHNYVMQVYFSDYFDRVFINWVYLTLTLVGSATLWFALPLSIVPMIVTLAYVYFQPIAIWTIVPPSDNFTFDSFWSEIMLRWQLGTVVTFASMLLGDILTYIPIGYALYIFLFQGTTIATIATVDIVIICVSLVLTWIIQLTLHLVPAVVTMVYLEV